MTEMYEKRFCQENIGDSVKVKMSIEHAVTFDVFLA
jgi:hypothetical protein